MGIVVALDGPAGSGKGTVTKIVAEKLNLVYIDTGAMYRCVALKCVENGIKPEEIDQIKDILNNIDIKLVRDNDKQKVYLSGKDVTNEIRSNIIDSSVAEYAKIKEVRDIITPMQQKMNENQNIIMEGRDIGTVVFPNADVKIFLDCSVEERARRRYKQKLESGIEANYEEVLQEIQKRHKLETEREISPFVKAEDAIVVDSTTMTIDEVVNQIIEIINEKVNL